MPCKVHSLADDIAIIVTSHQLVLLVNYLVLYLGDQKKWLRNWRIAIILESTAMIFAKAGRCIPTSSAFRGANPLG